MDRDMKWLGIFGVTAIAIYGIFQYSYPSTTYRYRMTIVAEADGKEISGSGVVEVTHENRVPWMTNSASILAATARGEAFSVDFGSKGRMFVLLRGSERCSLPEHLIPSLFEIKRKGNDRDYLNQLAQVRGMKRIPRTCLPMFVRFGDTANPTTLELMEPEELARYFDENVRFTAATIEITNDSVTSGIDMALPWLRKAPTRVVKRTDAYRILLTDFKRTQ
jgi:hypothetical protein